MTGVHMGISSMHKNPAKHILTLQKLSNILNYKELNSKSDDDFNPAQFGFDADPPQPGKYLIHNNLNSNFNSPIPEKIKLNLPNQVIAPPKQ